MLTTSLASISFNSSGASWEGTDDFSSGILATNWPIIQQANVGVMTVAGANGHASFLVSSSQSTEQNAYIVWRGNPSAAEDWTAQITGHNSSPYGSGASQLQFAVLRVDGAGTAGQEGYEIAMDRRASGPTFGVSQWINGGYYGRVSETSAGADFTLRFVYRSASNVIEAWHDATLLDSINLTDFSPTMTATNHFLFAILGNTDYGPISEGQLYADDFILTSSSPPTDFMYSTNNGAITITGYAGPGGAVSIPSEITGLPLKSIGDGAFYNASSLVSILMPNSVTNIGNGAFSTCGNLSSVTIPNSVIRIGMSAFIQCTSLATVTIGNSVTSIANSMFFGCTALTDVTIPNGVTNIGAQAFLRCSSLTSFTIPPNVTSIGSSAFQECSSLTNVALGNSLITIGDGAFGGCVNLSSLTVPTNVTSIGVSAFSGRAMTSITIPPNVTYLGDGAFGNCSNLSSVTIPNSVTNIGDWMFNFCTCLTSIVVPNTVTSIGTLAFNHCSSLTNISLPRGITSISDHVFFFCSNLRSITIPSGVTSIGDSAFYACVNLTAVYFQRSAPSLGASVFDYDDNAIFYYLPGTAGWETFAAITGHPTVLWNPIIQSSGPNFGMGTNQFGFNITGTANIPIVVEASTNVTGAQWLALESGTLTNGLIYFSDSQWTNYPRRFYRIRSP